MVIAVDPGGGAWQAGGRTAPGRGVLLMSASVPEADIARGLNAGANDYLTKPFNPDELLARVRNLLAQRPA